MPHTRPDGRYCYSRHGHPQTQPPLPQCLLLLLHAHTRHAEHDIALRSAESHDIALCCNATHTPTASRCRRRLALDTACAKRGLTPARMQGARRAIFSEAFLAADSSVGLIVGPQACGKSVVAAKLAQDPQTQVPPPASTHTLSIDPEYELSTPSLLVHRPCRRMCPTHAAWQPTAAAADRFICSPLLSIGPRRAPGNPPECRPVLPPLAADTCTASNRSETRCMRGFGAGCGRRPCAGGWVRRTLPLR